MSTGALFDNISLSSSLEREIVQTKLVEKIKTHILYSIRFSRL
jgi:hypothetical protein